MKLSILFRCTEAAHICDKSQYKESSKWERQLMRLHHLICKVCRQHSELNSRLTGLIQKAQPHSLPENSRKLIKERIEKALKA